jgi:hypothetical protein
MFDECLSLGKLGQTGIVYANRLLFNSPVARTKQRGYTFTGISSLSFYVFLG